MDRQRRISVLFGLLLVASVVLVTVALVRKADECAGLGGRLVGTPRNLQCQLPDGSLIPF